MTFSLVDSTVITTNPSTPRARLSSSHGFFVGMSTVLLALVLVGFAPTFYLRAYRGTSQLPALVQRLPLHLYVHGVVLTLWFVLFLVQTALVASHRINQHVSERESVADYQRRPPHYQERPTPRDHPKRV